MPIVDMTIIVVLLHTASTLFMTGLIWFVQVVHYPLKSAVGDEMFIAYQQAHMKKTGWVVGPPMLLEGASALWLALFPPEALGLFFAWIALVLLGLIWLSTAVFSVPAHNQLLNGFNKKAHRRLVASNWLRTVGWSLRSIYALCILACLMPSQF